MGPPESGLLKSNPFWLGKAEAVFEAEAPEAEAPRGGYGTTAALPLFFKDCLNVELTLARSRSKKSKAQ